MPERAPPAPAPSASWGAPPSTWGERCPGKSYLILEGRPSMGGTWDLFRHPGVRSDTDMHTLC